MKPFHTSPLCGALLVALLAGASAAGAQLRCGTNLIKDGDSVLALLEACGEPTIGYTAFYDHAEWTYNFGPEDFMKKVIIRNGRVERIDNLGRGYVPGTEAGSPGGE